MTDIPVLDYLDACKGVYNDFDRFCFGFGMMSEVWEACDDVGWMLDLAHMCADVTKEQSVRIAVAAADTCAHLIPEDETWPLEALEAAKMWLADPSEPNRRATIALCEPGEIDPSLAVQSHDRSPAQKASRAAYYAARSTSLDATASFEDAYNACGLAALSSGDGYWDVNAKLCDMIRSIVPNPFLPAAENQASVS